MSFLPLIYFFNFLDHKPNVEAWLQHQLQLRLKKYVNYPFPIAFLFAKEPQEALMSLPLLRLNKDKKPLS